MEYHDNMDNKEIKGVYTDEQLQDLRDRQDDMANEKEALIDQKDAVTAEMYDARNKDMYARFGVESNNKAIESLGNATEGTIGYRVDKIAELEDRIADIDSAQRTRRDIESIHAEMKQIWAQKSGLEGKFLGGFRNKTAIAKLKSEYDKLSAKMDTECAKINPLKGKFWIGIDAESGEQKRAEIMATINALKSKIAEQEKERNERYNNRGNLANEAKDAKEKREVAEQKETAVAVDYSNRIREMHEQEREM